MMRYLVSLLMSALVITTYAQKVYAVDSQWQADGNEGKWYFTDSEWQADKKVYFVDSEWQADLKIYFVDSEWQAGWEDKSTIHIMY